MIKYIAILRGVNVGGKRKILMADLKQLFEKLDFNNVFTYIQSGNVIFKTKKKDGNTKFADLIEKSIADNYGFEVPIIIREFDEIEKIIMKNPFKKGDEITDIKRLHVTFLKNTPKKSELDKIATYDFNPDKFEIIDNNIFVFCSGKYSDSKLTNKFFESKLKVSATTRNWKTVQKLYDLSISE